MDPYLESRGVAKKDGNYGGPPAHWLLSRNMGLDSVQLRAQEAGQQLENKALLLLTGNVPTNTQCRHVSGSPPVLQSRQRETHNTVNTWKKYRCLGEEMLWQN